MGGEPELDSPTRLWAALAQENLSALLDALAPLRAAFESDWAIGSEAASGLAAGVVAACGRVTEWLSARRAPKGLGRAEAELGAVAGVYRNAAVAFRSVAEAGVDQRQVRCDACAKMLEQGDHHVEAFVTTVDKKLGQVGLKRTGTAVTPEPVDDKGD